MPIFLRKKAEVEAVRTVKRFAFLPTNVKIFEGNPYNTLRVWLTNYYSKQIYCYVPVSYSSDSEFWYWHTTERFLDKKENVEDYT